MLETYDLGKDRLDALDLKCMLVSAGMRYPERVYNAVEGKVRLESPFNPFACNCVILPGEVAVHLHQNDASSFVLDLDANGDVCLFHNHELLFPVSFPPPTDYYTRQTRDGKAYGGIAVLEGNGVLAFFYMWKCEYIKTNETCTFCFQVMADMAGFDLPSPTHEEVAEIIEYGIDHAGVKEIQLTAGKKFAGQRECAQYADLLRTIDRRVGLDRIPSEIYCYVTAPREPHWIDQVFDAGADRVAHDIHVWDRALHARFAPGHARNIGREGQLRALEYIAEKYGPNKAFSAFVAGLEPLDSMIEGAEWLASRGIVPAFSVWMPTPGSTDAETKPPGLDYYRTARQEFARLYKQYDLNPPGIPAGSHVSLCRDIYRNMDELLALV